MNLRQAQTVYVKDAGGNYKARERSFNDTISSVEWRQSKSKSK
ncbi:MULTISPECIES: hypothetical protein [Streptomyces]|nr:MULTISPECIES: hypothetical protein [Streptomyces]WSI60807.1 hypothetical protein OG471_01380 [Streptomyces sp. NBC_01336]